MTTDIKIIENKIVIGNKEYSLEKKLVKKLERIVKGVTQENPKEDAVFINEGKERKGKTNSSVIEATYLKVRTRREVHLFFRLEALMEFAKTTKEMILIWDEPALDSLSRDQLKELNMNMQRLFMVIGKKRHIFLINYTKFWKFPEYIVVDRANGMLHMSEKKMGRFFYIRQKRLEFLWNEYRTKHKRAYLRAASFGGDMPDFMRYHFNELGFYVNNVKNATIEDYEREKDIATQSIGVKASKKTEEVERKLLETRENILRMPLTIAQKSAIMKVAPRVVSQMMANLKAKESLRGDVPILEVDDAPTL